MAWSVVTDKHALVRLSSWLRSMMFSKDRAFLRWENLASNSWDSDGDVNGRHPFLKASLWLLSVGDETSRDLWLVMPYSVNIPVNILINE
jgi:hypothetical protein